MFSKYAAKLSCPLYFPLPLPYSLLYPCVICFSLATLFLSSPLLTPLLPEKYFQEADTCIPVLKNPGEVPIATRKMSKVLDLISRITQKSDFSFTAPLHVCFSPVMQAICSFLKVPMFSDLFVFALLVSLGEVSLWWAASLRIGQTLITFGNFYFGPFPVPSLGSMSSCFYSLEYLFSL